MILTEVEEIIKKHPPAPSKALLSAIRIDLAPNSHFEQKDAFATTVILFEHYFLFKYF